MDNQSPCPPCLPTPTILPTAQESTARPYQRQSLQCYSSHAHSTTKAPRIFQTSSSSVIRIYSAQTPASNHSRLPLPPYLPRHRPLRLHNLFHGTRVPIPRLLAPFYAFPSPTALTHLPDHNPTRPQRRPHNRRARPPPKTRVRHNLLLTHAPANGVPDKKCAIRNCLRP